jgi:hypothetical protein
VRAYVEHQGLFLISSATYRRRSSPLATAFSIHVNHWPERDIPGHPIGGVSRSVPLSAHYGGTFWDIVPFGPVWSRSFHGSHMNRFPLCSLATRRLALIASAIERLNALRCRSARASSSSFGPAFSAMAV